MKPTTIICIVMLFISCNNPSATTSTAPQKDSPLVVVPADTIPLTRASVSKAPVASYSTKVEDELNDWVFAVKMFETKNTFKFLMKMQYEELTAQDTISIPNFGIKPTVVLKKGSERYSCIIGFLGKDSSFKEYKMVSAKADKLKVTTLKSYSVTTYSK